MRFPSKPTSSFADDFVPGQAALVQLAEHAVYPGVGVLHALDGILVRARLGEVEVHRLVVRMHHEEKARSVFPDFAGRAALRIRLNASTSALSLTG